MKFIEVLIKEFIKFALFAKDPLKRRFFFEKLGAFSLDLAHNSKDKWFWIHANAIGEVNSSQQLISLLRENYPAVRILLTTANFSADLRARQLRIADRILFFPHDVPCIIIHFLKVFHTICVVILETDIWPNFVKVCNRKGIPVLVVSGVCGVEKSRSVSLRYLYNYTFALSKNVLGNVERFGMQSESDARRLSDLIPGHRIAVTGNLKFSCLNLGGFLEKKRYYQNIFNLKSGDYIFLAGNAHVQECEIILKAFLIAKGRIENLILVLTPRFIQSISYIKSLLIQNEVAFITRTKLNDQPRKTEPVILVDTIGELADMYAVADVAFVGGSLVYLGDMFGGHNILEPAAAGSPILFGTFMHNFQNIADLFKENNAALQVSNAEELAYSIIKLIGEPSQACAMVSKAKDICRENAKVAVKTFLFIDDKLKQLRYN